jgi:hypothetical protein
MELRLLFAAKNSVSEYKDRIWMGWRIRVVTTGNEEAFSFTPFSFLGCL